MLRPLSLSTLLPLLDGDQFRPISHELISLSRENLAVHEECPVRIFFDVRLDSIDESTTSHFGTTKDDRNDEVDQEAVESLVPSLSVVRHQSWF